MSEEKQGYIPDHKPRFFLHDEMKLWLKDNLRLHVINHLGTPAIGNATQKLNLFHPIKCDISSGIDIVIDGESISQHIIYFDNTGVSEALTKLTEYLEIAMLKNAELATEVGTLKLEIEQLKQKNNG
jgi:hypothetical protein